MGADYMTMVAHLSFFKSSNCQFKGNNLIQLADTGSASQMVTKCSLNTILWVALDVTSLMWVCYPSLTGSVQVWQGHCWLWQPTAKLICSLLFKEALDKMYKCVKKKKLGRYLKYQEKNMQCYMLMRLLKTQANHFRTEAMNVRHSVAIVRCLRWMSANELHLFFNRLTELACTDSKHHLLRSLLSALQTFRQEDKCVLFVVVPNKGNTKKEELEHQEWLSQKWLQ